MTYSLGVDLGTTTVAAAVARPDGARMVPLGERSVTAPAVLHVGDDGAVAVGDGAERLAVSRPDGAVRELRRRLGDPRPVRLGAASYPVTALLGAQLRHVLRRVTGAEGGPPALVVLTRPASWDAVRRARFDEVWATAGIVAPLVVTEPEAAALAALEGRWREGENVAVYDLGGGSFHATVVRRRGGGVEILGAPEGDERLGGVEVDGAVLDHVADVVGNGGRIEIDGDDPGTVAALARLRQDCIRAKEALSSDVEAVVPVFLPGRHVEVRLTRATVEEMIRTPLESTMRATARTIASAGLISSDLSSVLLMGGSSRIPLVGEMLTQQFGRPVVSAPDPENAVALGAARLGAARLGAARLGAARLGAAQSEAARLGTPRLGSPTGPVPRRPGNHGGPPPRASIGGEVRPLEAVGAHPAPPLSAPGASTPDGLTQVVSLPRVVAGPPDPGRGPRRRLSPFVLPVVAAALAVLVLAAVFVLAPAAPDPLPVPAGAPASTAPVPVPSSAAVATTVATTAPPPRTTARPSRTPRPTTPRTTRSTRTRSAPTTTTRAGRG